MKLPGWSLAPSYFLALHFRSTLTWSASFVCSLTSSFSLSYLLPLLQVSSTYNYAFRIQSRNDPLSRSRAASYDSEWNLSLLSCFVCLPQDGILSYLRIPCSYLSALLVCSKSFGFSRFLLAKVDTCFQAASHHLGQMFWMCENA